jgi:hypothetical protein
MIAGIRENGQLEVGDPINNLKIPKSGCPA